MRPTQADGVATSVPLAVSLALSLAGSPAVAPDAETPRDPPPEPAQPLDITPRYVDDAAPRTDLDAPLRAAPAAPTAAAPVDGATRVTGPPADVSLGAGWEGTLPVDIPRDAGARASISQGEVAVWAPPPAWAPPPPTSDRYDGSERWRTIHFGLAVGVVAIMTAVGLGLTLPADDPLALSNGGPTSDGTLPPATQFDALFPR